MPSLAISTLSKREVNDAVALGKPLPVGLKARLPVGGGASGTGNSASPHASISVNPVFAPSRCVNVARIREVSSFQTATTLARRPIGTELRRWAGIGVHALPSQ